MTMLVSWVGVDPHGPTSMYIAADSRISWDAANTFDFAKKVFASKKYPEIFGYAGDVLFPSIVLGQIVELIDAGILLNTTMTCDQKNKIIFEKICESLSKYKFIMNDSKGKIEEVRLQLLMLIICFYY